MTNKKYLAMKIFLLIILCLSLFTVNSIQKNSFTINFIILNSIIGFIGLYLIHYYFNNEDKLQKEKDKLTKRYEYALEGSKIGIWDWNLISRTIFFDSNWKKMLGYENEEIDFTIKSWKKLIHPDDIKQALINIYDNQSEKTLFYSNVYRIKHKNGTWLWILDKGKTYFDESHNPIRMIGSCTNISKIKEIEVSFSESKENLMLAQKIMNAGYWRYNVTDDLFILSDTLKELLKINKDQKFSYNDFKKLIVDEDYEKVVKVHSQMAQNKDKTVLSYKINKYNSKKFIHVEEHIQHSNSDSSKKEMCIGTIQDISKRIIIEEELYNLRFIIDSSPISILVTNLSGNIIYVNLQFSKTTGYSKEELVGQNPRIIKHKDSSSEVYKKLWETITAKKKWEGTFKNLKKDGTSFWESAIILPILNKDNNIINYLGIKNEITEEIYLNQELLEKEDIMLYQSKSTAMEEMLSMIAHQWRQPISAISLAANNIIVDIDLDAFDKDESREILTTITKQTEYLSNTIDNFRNFFKKDRKIKISSIKDIFEKIESIIQAFLTNNKIKVVKNFDENLKIRTYENELLQVLVNIIKNAKDVLVERNIEKKEIIIKIIESEQFITFAISDNAGGIEEEYIGKVFDAYFTTKDEKNGTGLGLYTSKVIVEKYLGGSLSIYNGEKGATFTISLPK